MLTPAYNPAFSKPLLNQLIAIIQRDQGSAIQLVNPALAPITEFHKGPAACMALPWLALMLRSTQFSQQVTGTRASTTSLTLELDVGQFDQEIGLDNAQDYARVLDMVITSASPADFTTPLPIAHETVPTGMTTPPAVGSVKEVFISAHKYSLVKASDLDAPVLRVSIEVVLGLEES
jgi:hypothetical protein